MGLPELSNTLWRERNLLDLLLFKLEEEQLVLAAGRTRWLARATHEVELILEEIQMIELARAVEVDAVAMDLGLGPNASLQELADRAPTPWGTLLAQHRTAFLQLTQEVVETARANRELLAEGARATEEALSWLSGSADRTAETYAPTGGRGGPGAGARHRVPALSSPRLFDGAL